MEFSAVKRLALCIILVVVNVMIIRELGSYTDMLFSKTETAEFTVKEITVDEYNHNFITVQDKDGLNEITFRMDKQDYINSDFNGENDVVALNVKTLGATTKYYLQEERLFTEEEAEEKDDRKVTIIIILVFLLLFILLMFGGADIINLFADILDIIVD